MADVDVICIATPAMSSNATGVANLVFVDLPVSPCSFIADPRYTYSVSDSKLTRSPTIPALERVPPGVLIHVGDPTLRYSRCHSTSPGPAGSTEHSSFAASATIAVAGSHSTVGGLVDSRAYMCTSSFTKSVTYT